MKEKKLRIEDALNATRAAVEEGIVAGGGTAYVNAVPAVEKLISEVEGDEKTGVQIIVKALQEPVRQIAANAGIDGSVVLEKIKTCLLYTSRFEVRQICRASFFCAEMQILIYKR